MAQLNINTSFLRCKVHLKKLVIIKFFGTNPNASISSISHSLDEPIILWVEGVSKSTINDPAWNLK